MKNLLNILLLLAFSFLSSQKLQPVIGGRYTGGLSYAMDHEYFSGEVGLQYLPAVKPKILDNLKFTGEYVYDYAQTYIQGENNLYVLRLQARKYFSDVFAFEYYAGYMDNFKNKEMISKFAWGIGVSITSNEVLTAQLMYENLNNHPHVSIGVSFTLWNILKD